MGHRPHAAALAGSLLAVLALAAGAPAPLWAAVSDERASVPASERYQRNRLHRFVLGDGYRPLWKQPVDLPLLDLAREGGGLEPTRRFGGLQTPVLGFKGRDGRAYTFRGTDKDPSAVLDPLLQDSIAKPVVQDQMSAQHPGGALVASEITVAAGVLTARERLVLMPDDPVLGEFREEFAGLVGTFYEFPTPASDAHSGFHGASEIIDQKALYERLRRGHDDRVALRAFLRARLVDILLGDFDRHRKQWRWAKLPGSPEWQPIPEDRDMAFVRYTGVGLRIAYLYLPILQKYGPEYPAMKGLTFHGWEQDRWLLPALSWEDWEVVARDVQARITDEVIDGAVDRLPPEYERLDGERLRRDLRGRRDLLLAGARSFYEHLADEVDIQGSDVSERVVVTHAPDGAMLVELSKIAAGSEGPAAFHRRFDPDETSDVRVYLRGGEDRVTVTGTPGPITLRVIGGGGAAVLDDSQGGRTRLYDSEHAVEVLPGRGTYVDLRPYEPPETGSGFVDVEDVPPRDWGSDTIPIPSISFEEDVGAYLGMGLVHTRYGFRKHPWSSQHRLDFGWATRAAQPRVRYQGVFRPENSPVRAGLDVLLSGIETLRFYGLGNETSDAGSDSFFRVQNQQYRVAPLLQVPMADERFLFTIGPWLEYSRTERGARLIDILSPYGSGSFGSVGSFGSIRFDTRTSLSDEELRLALPFHDTTAAGYPLGGFLVDLTTGFSPALWDVDSTYGWLEGSAASYLSAGEDGRATLALRVGGKQTFGRTPYFAAAYIGGGQFFGGGPFGGDVSVRGFRAQRFGGDSSVYGNADLRIFLARVKILFPGDLGVLGFADVGRVFVEGQSSDRWHPSGGGGIWFAPLARTNAFSVSVADSREDTLVYFRLGFHY